MKKYRCKKDLILDYYDADGFSDDSKQIEINVGDIYEYNEDCQDTLIVACKPAIHLYLVNDNIHQWIEIYPETLAEYFEEMKEGGNDRL